MKRLASQRGFTFIEILIVIGIMAILFSIVVLGVLNVRTSADINATFNLLMTDIKNQQIKAMVGDTEGRGTPDAYSILLQNTSYVLFNGQNYSAGNTANFSVSLPTGLRLTTTFPSSKIVFATNSGELVGFVVGQDTLTVTEAATGRHKTLKFNKYGAFVSLQ